MLTHPGSYRRGFHICNTARLPLVRDETRGHSSHDASRGALALSVFACWKYLLAHESAAKGSVRSRIGIGPASRAGLQPIRSPGLRRTAQLMVFWALHFALGLSGLFALGFAWRWGIILLYTLVVELFTFLWMMLPLFSVRYEIVAMVLGGLVVGAVIATGRDPMPPWIGAAGAAALLLVLRGSLIALGLLDGTTSSE